MVRKYNSEYWILYSSKWSFKNEEYRYLKILWDSECWFATDFNERTIKEYIQQEK